jgi:hypothetical protein
MKDNYSKIESPNSSNRNTTEIQSHPTPIRTDVNLTSLEKDSFEPIEYEDVKNEESIFEIFTAKDYPEVMSGILQSIDNYYQDNDTYDDYPYFRVQNTCKFIPKLSHPSEILSERQLRELHAHLPYYHQYRNLKLVYSMTKDGCALKTFYMKSHDVKNSILIVKDDNQNVFGAYASEEFYSAHKFYGTGESFLFTFFKTERIHCFPSTGSNEHYIYSDEKMLAFGCSDDYFSLCLENDFLSGYSKMTQTYKNPPLTPKDSFFVIKLELWTFMDK